MMSPARGEKRSEGQDQIFPVLFFSVLWPSLTLSRSSGLELAQTILGIKLWRTKELPVPFAIDYGGWTPILIQNPY